MRQVRMEPSTGSWRRCGSFSWLPVVTLLLIGCVHFSQQVPQSADPWPAEDPWPAAAHSAVRTHHHQHHHQHHLQVHQRRRNEHSVQRRDRGSSTEWSCPQVNGTRAGITCQCDLPHTLRCAGVAQSAQDMTSIVNALRRLPDRQSVSLLDLSIQNLSRVAGHWLFDQVSLHGLVISSGEVVEVTDDAFVGLGPTLTALGLPNNRLTAVPHKALRTLIHLERLDLSNNRIQAVTSHLFDGLDNLRFLDLSGNVVQTLAADAFASLAALRTLHLRSNLLDSSQLNPSSLRGLKRLQELDLSYNKLRGRLTTSFLQGLDNLQQLDLSVNNVTLLKRGMLSSLKRLQILKLAYNQIDVIEDQAFVALTSLTSLDLSHNGIVAISGQSLSHLNSLSQLDLSHNYLRALTADLVVGLTRLESLDLTDNDITIVQAAAVDHLGKLVHLSLTDNPLTCDCNLVDFGWWLQNRTRSARLADEDRRSAVCATPPLLENGLLLETESTALTCGDDGDISRSGDVTSSGPSGAPVPRRHESDNFLSSQPTEDFIRLSSAQVQFISAELEHVNILHTIWNVNAATLPYSCDAILVYELNDDQEVLLDSYPVGCHSDDPTKLNGRLELTVKLGDNMKIDGQYRLCLVLFEGGHDDEASLLPGCSHSMTWDTLKTWHYNSAETPVDESTDHQVDWSMTTRPAQITAFYANVTTSNAVSVYLRIPDASAQCQFTVVVFEGGHLLATKSLNCSVMSYTFGQLLAIDQTPPSEYQVCATFDTHGQFLPPPDGYQRQADGDIILSPPSGNQSAVQYSHCVVAKMPAPRLWPVENTLVIIGVAIAFVFVAAALLIASYALARRVFFRRSKLLSSWTFSSSDPLSASGSGSGSGPKTASRHILYVPENDYFSDSSSSNSGADREETSTNV